MDSVERFRKIAIKRGLTPGALLDACPEDFDLLLLSLRREFPVARTVAECEVNEILYLWLQSTGGMLDVDHVELRRWLVDLSILSRDAYGRAYSLASLPSRLATLAADVAGVDFSREFADANAQESQKRAARKLAWQQVGSAP
jgi:hypothetical protein